MAGLTQPVLSLLLLEECYTTFGTRQHRKGLTSPIWWTEKNMTPFTQKKIREMAEKLEEYQIYCGPGTAPANKLSFTGATGTGDETKNETHLGNNTGTAWKAVDPDEIKSILYNLQTGQKTDTTNPHIYKGKIDNWLEDLHDLYNWRQGGFEYNWEVLIARRLGFQIADVSGHIHIKDKKFMGFEILKGVDGNPLEIEKATDTTPSSATDASTTIAGPNGFKIKGSNNFHNQKYTNDKINYVLGGEIDIAAYKKPENQIRALRALEVKDGGTGANTAPFWYDDNSSGTTVKKSIFADPKRVSQQDLFGFQPQDLQVFKGDTGDPMNANLNNVSAGTAGKKFLAYNLKNGSEWTRVKKDSTKSKCEYDHITTRIKFLLMDADSISGAVRIAFTGNIYKTGDPDTEKAFHQLEPEIPNGTTQNGIVHSSKLGILKDYYDFIKGCSVNYTDIKRKYIPKNDTLGGTKGTDESQLACDILEETYAEAKKWARIWDENYSSKDKSFCNDDKAYLESIENQVDPSTLSSEISEAGIRWQIKHNKEWMNEVRRKKTEIDARINELDNPAGETLNKLIASETREIAKNIFRAAAAKLGGSMAPSEQIKELANLIEKVKGGTAVTADLLKLREYKAASEAGADTDEKKKAWDIANEVKDSGIIDGSTNGAGADALQKMENALQAAKKAAKTAMDSEGGDSDDGAYKKIGIEGMNDVAQINEITQMFNEIKNAYTSSYDKDATPTLKSKLEVDYKTNKAAAWGKIEQYKKNGKGFGTGAIEYLSSLNDKQILAADKLKNESADGNSLLETWKNTSADERGGIEEDTAKRLAAAVELEKKGDTDEDKELGKLLGDSLNSGETFFPNVTKDSDEGLTKINDLINKLESYVNAPEMDNKGKAVKKIQDRVTDIDDAKAVLNAWINQLKNRKSTLEQQKKDLQKNDDKGNEEEKGHFAKHWWKYGLGVLGIAAVVGLGWLAFKSGDEEGGEGDE